MSRRPSSLLLVGLMAVSAFAPGDAFAQPAASPAAARPAQASVAVDHFKEAVDLFGRSETVAACRKFEQSYAEDAAPGTLYNMAVCHEREGLVADAYREYADPASRAVAFGLTDKAASVRARADTLLPKLARVDLVHRSDAVAAVTLIQAMDIAAFAGNTLVVGQGQDAGGDFAILAADDGGNCARFGGPAPLGAAVYLHAETTRFTVVAFTSSSEYLTTSQLALSRYTLAGELDTTVGPGGYLTIPLPPFSTIGRGALQNGVLYIPVWVSEPVPFVGVYRFIEDD